MEFNHISVLPEEVINGLNIKEDGVYIDCTLGGGGHSSRILEKLKCGHLYGIDQDIEAINASKSRLESKGNITFINDNFKNISNIIKEYNIKNISGALLDLGVSSYQLDNGSRGFSYREDGPLDMRMDRSKPFSAYNVVNEYSLEELNRIIKKYGEERFSYKISERIIKERESGPINTTKELVKIIEDVIPKRLQIEYGNPCKRTFQAIRIEVNNELEILEETIETIVDNLEVGGRILVITFHSLEDRVVKETFKRLENPCICPPYFPVCVCGKKSMGKIITRKPIIPKGEEIVLNRRSKSSKLRIFQKGDIS